MKRLTCLSLTVLLLLTLMLTGCAGSDPGGSAATPNTSGTTVLKFMNSQSPDEAISKEIEEFARLVGERTDGSLEIQVFHNGVLGDDDEAVEMVHRGGDVITMQDPAKLAYYVPDYAIMAGPYLFENIDEITTLAFSDWGEEMAQASADIGIKVLENCSVYFGTRHTISTKPFTSPADIRGVKFRVPATPIFIETVSAMGASPTTISFSEVYTALSQGVADAAENPVTGLYAANFQEVCDYLVLTGHFVAANALLMSNDVFESLPAEFQEALVEEAIAMAQRTHTTVAAEEEEVLVEMINAGVTVIEPDLEAFQQATESVYTKFPEWSDGLVERVFTILEDARS